jgi:hypothetical protein
MRMTRKEQRLRASQVPQRGLKIQQAERNGRQVQTEEVTDGKTKMVMFGFQRAKVEALTVGHIGMFKVQEAPEVVTYIQKDTKDESRW